MTTPIIDTSESVIRSRPMMDFPRLELDTLYGKAYLTIGAERTAYFSTEQNAHLTINGVKYRISCKFQYGRKPHEDANVPSYWHRVQSYGMNLRRNDYLSSGKSEYTQAAFDAVERNVIPLLCSFLTQNPDMVIQAEKVAINNEIGNQAENFFRKMEEAEDIKKNYFDLIEKEKTL